MFTLYIHTESAAFEDEPVPETARILRAVADRLESGTDASHFLTIFDINGNDVGRFKLGENE